MLDKPPLNHARPRRHAAIAVGAVLTALLSGTLAGTAPTDAAAFPPPPPDPETTVKILEPANGTQALYGSLFGDRFTATATSNWGSCCTIKWSSNIDGALGSGKSIEHSFGSPGTRIVTATATSSKGIKGKASVTVVAKNVPPSVSIVKPAPNVLYSNVSYKFQGHAQDANQPLSGVPCASLHWSTTPFTQWQPNPGCGTVTKFPAAGIYQVRLNTTDPYGAAAPTAVKTITVKNKPKNSRPSVTIVQPEDDTVLQPGATHTLKALGSDVDNDPITYTWWIKYGTSTTVTSKVIGHAAQISWKPMNDVPFNCGGRSVTITVTASDNDGSASDWIAGRVAWGPC